MIADLGWSLKMDSEVQMAWCRRSGVGPTDVDLFLWLVIRHSSLVDGSTPFSVGWELPSTPFGSISFKESELYYYVKFLRSKRSQCRLSWTHVCKSSAMKGAMAHQIKEFHPGSNLTRLVKTNQLRKLVRVIIKACIVNHIHI